MIVRAIVEMTDYCQECGYGCCPIGCFEKGCKKSPFCDSFPVLFYQGDYTGPLGVLGSGGWEVLYCAGARIKLRDNTLKDILDDLVQKANTRDDFFYQSRQGVALRMEPTTMLTLKSLLEDYYQNR